MRIPFLDLRAQTTAVEEGFHSAAKELLARNQFIGGPPVSEFEEAFAEYCGAAHCVALNSGTDALRLALLAGGINPHDEVITSPFTFIATAEAIGQVGRLVLADVDPDTFTLDPGSVEGRITKRSRAVVPVHIFGLCSDMHALGSLARDRGLLVVEDACQAHGAELDGRRVGSLGDAAAFSFYPSKNLSAFGDAGAVTTNRTSLAERVRLLRNHGQVAPYSHVAEGFNSRMDTLQASVLTLKLPLLEGWNDERSRLADLYRLGLGDLEQVRFQSVPAGRLHVYHVMAALVQRRDELAAFLASEEVDARIIYPTPLHLMEAYRHLQLGRGRFPVAERISNEVICFPMFPGLSSGQVERIVSLVRRFYGCRS